MTLGERLASAKSQLVAAGIAREEAALDVDVYVREILGWDRAQLLSEMRDGPPAALEPCLTEWLIRRAGHEPTAYIVGHKEFWGRSFRVTPAVLIPRPETEFIVEETLQLLAAGSAARLADIGTGSGCLAVTLASELPGCTVVATDISDDALAVARENAITHQVDARTDFRRTSYLDGVVGPFDLIVGNPPYVPASLRAALGRGVLHEPEVALFGGPDGTRDLAGVLDAAISTLVPGGWCVLEFGFGQEPDVERLIDARPRLHLERVRSDLQGLPRTAVIRHQG